MEANNIKYFKTREEWRKWLEDNFNTEKEVWLVYPNKSSGKACILYNDAVEEALCFSWIDSILKKLDEQHRMQRFTPRKNKGYYSQINKERLKRLAENNMIHPSIREEIKDVIQEEFVFPIDILKRLKKDKTVWENYNNFSESYKRIRIAYIEVARNYPEEFEKRLTFFINKTKDNKKITGYGGTDKYY